MCYILIKSGPINFRPFITELKIEFISSIWLLTELDSLKIDSDSYPRHRDASSSFFICLGDFVEILMTFQNINHASYQV